MTKEIQLTQGEVAIVDAADYEWLSQWKWHARRDGWNWYAGRKERMPNGKWRIVHMHREILGVEPGIQVDHKNGDGLNNTRANLRPATNQQNQHNASLRIDNTSGYKGVSWNKDCGKWRAFITANGKRKHIGLFTTAEEASEAYDAAARELHGEFARTNFSEGAI